MMQRNYPAAEALHRDIRTLSTPAKIDRALRRHGIEAAPARLQAAA